MIEAENSYFLKVNQSQNFLTLPLFESNMICFTCSLFRMKSDYKCNILKLHAHW